MLIVEMSFFNKISNIQIVCWRKDLWSIYVQRLASPDTLHQHTCNVKTHSM